MVRQRFQFTSQSVSNSSIGSSGNENLTPLLYPRYREIYHLKAYKLWLWPDVFNTDFQSLNHRMTFVEHFLANPHMEATGGLGNIEANHRKVLDTLRREITQVGQDAVTEFLVEGYITTGWVYTDLPVIGLWIKPLVLTPNESSGHRFGAFIEYEQESGVEVEHYISIAALYDWDVDQISQHEGRADLSIR